MSYILGRNINLKITNRGIMEQIFPSVGKVSHPKKRITKQTKGRYKNMEHKIVTGHLVKPKHIK